MRITKSNLKLIVGKEGYVGNELLSTIQQNKLPFLCTSRKGEGENVLQLDIRKIDDNFFSNIPRYSIVYMLASISSPDLCQKNYESARKTNVDATCDFIARCIKEDMRVCFASTDAVYGRCSNICDESAEVSPLGAYGEMKAEVENFFSKEENFKAVRFSYILSMHDKFSNYLKKCSENNEVAELFDPFIRSVVGLPDVVSALINLDTQWEEMPSKINFAGPEQVSREDIALAFKKVCDARLKFKITTPPESFFYNRPRQINMGSKYFHQLLGRNPLGVEEIYSYYSGIN